MEDHNHNEKMIFLMGEMSSDIKSILAEAKKTNGRVNELEREVGILKTFNTVLKTKVAMVSGVISLVGFVVWEFIKSKIQR